MAERRTLLSQVSKQTSPLQAGVVRTSEGSFGNYSGLQKFGGDVADVGAMGANAAENEIERKKREYTILKDKAERIAANNIEAGFKSATIAANIALEQHMADLDEIYQKKGARPLIGEERTAAVNDFAPRFNKIVEEKMSTVTAQYPTLTAQLVSPQVKGAAWDGVRDNHIIQGFKYSAAKMHEQALSDWATNQEAEMRASVTDMEGTYKTGYFQLKAIEANSNFTKQEKMTMGEVVRKSVANNLSALAGSQGFETVVDAAWKDSVINPEAKNALLANDRSAQALLHAKTGPINEAFKQMLDKRAAGDEIAPGVKEPTLRDAMSIASSPSDAFRSYYEPNVLHAMVGDARKMLANGVMPGGDYINPFETEAILNKNAGDPETDAFVLGALQQVAMREERTSQAMAAMGNGFNGAAGFGKETLDKAHSALREIATYQANMIRAGRGAEVFYYAEDVQAALRTGKPADYQAALMRHYKAANITDPTMIDLTNPGQSRDLMQSGAQDSPDAIEKTYGKINEIIDTQGLQASRTLEAVATRGDKSIHGVMAAAAAMVTNSYGSNTFQREALNSFVASATWVDSPEGKKMLEENKEQVANIRRMADRAASATYADETILDEDDDLPKSFKKLEDGTEVSMFARSPLGRLLQQNGTYQGVKKMVEDRFLHKFLANTTRGTPADDQRELIKIANEVKQEISRFWIPMKLSGNLDGSPVWGNSPYLSGARTDFLAPHHISSWGSDRMNAEAPIDVLDSTFAAYIPVGGEGTSLGYNISQFTDKVQGIFFAGPVFGRHVIFNKTPNLSLRYLSITDRTRKMGLDLFTKTKNDPYTAHLKREDGTVVPLETAILQPETIKGEVRKSVQEYLGSRDPKIGTSLALAGNYVLYDDKANRRFYVFVRPDNLRFNEDVNIAPGTPGVPVWVDDPDGKVDAKGKRADKQMSFSYDDLYYNTGDTMNAAHPLGVSGSTPEIDYRIRHGLNYPDGRAPARLLYKNATKDVPGSGGPADVPSKITAPVDTSKYVK